jgi:hypothetical protein
VPRDIPPARRRAGGTAAPEFADLPVLHDEACIGSRHRPRVCGVEGCTAQILKICHLEACLCAAHYQCRAVLRGGVPQRWCGNCHVYHALEAFTGSLKCAPASRWERTGHPQA